MKKIIIYTTFLSPGIAGFVEMVFAQAGPPSLPAPPQPVPWEHFVLMMSGCLFYAVFRIIKKR